MFLAKLPSGGWFRWISLGLQHMGVRDPPKWAVFLFVSLIKQTQNGTREPLRWRHLLALQSGVLRLAGLALLLHPWGNLEGLDASPLGLHRKTQENRPFPLGLVGLEHGLSLKTRRELQGCAGGVKASRR